MQWICLSKLKGSQCDQQRYQLHHIVTLYNNVIEKKCIYKRLDFKGAHIDVFKLHKYPTTWHDLETWSKTIILQIQ